jgi:DNA-binding transcriptional MocR family regulator
MLRGGLQVAAVYTIPIHHNPYGVTLSPAKRSRLIKLAHEYKFFIFADEVRRHALVSL